MIAKFNGTCRSCDAGIHPGEQIEIFLKKWTHTACKAAELAARTAAGKRVELELVMPDEEEPEYAGTRFYRRRGVQFTRLANGR